MSIFTVNRAILPSAWPNNLGRPSSRPVDHQVCSSWRFVPEHSDELYDWATVIDDEEETCDGRVVKRLVYRPSVLPIGADDGLYEVTLVVQGFLREHSLTVLGNWSGRERDAPQAAQFMKLDGGAYQPIFAIQRRGLEDIRSLIQLHVGGDSSTGDDEEGITLRRSVFTKVRASGGDSHAIVLNDSNDPFGSARKMSRRWRVDHVVDTFVRRPNGTNARVAPEALQNGDFVETTVTAHIRLLRSRKQRKTVVEFHMHNVIRLWTAKEAKKVCGTPDDHDETPTAGCSRTPQAIRKVTSLLLDSDDRSGMIE